ncbi:MAG: hypothetical protein OEM04_05550, partial [Flavobacteriaceae bacterium]|nr:hypothetical protein [Flavobacteriaceae bacterium]
FSLGAGFTYFFDDDENDYFIFARTNVHFGELFDLPEALDIYPGVEIGYLSRGDIGICGYLGIRYFFTERFGIFAELGSDGAVGLSINL